MKAKQVKSRVKSQPESVPDQLTLRYVPLSGLTKWARNKKRHDLGSLVASIKRYGFRDALCWDVTLNNGEGGIVAGNGRDEALLSMKQAGEPAPRGILVDDKGEWLIPVVFGNDAKSQAEAESYAIDSNNLVLMGGDFGLSEIMRAWDDGFDVLLKELAEQGQAPVSIDMEDIEALIAAGQEPVDAEPQIDRAAELNKKWQVKTGDLWQVGGHKLLCGDSTKAEDVARVMGGEKADMVFTDPPYGINLDTDFSDMVGIGTGKKYKRIQGDDVDYDPEHIFRYFPTCKEVFLWGADYYAEKISNRNVGSWFVWDKMGGGNGVNDDYDKMFGSNFELCWSKTKHKRAIARILWKGIFGLAREDTKSRIHPTQKPTDLVAWFLSRFSIEGNIIADIFLGSGTTMVACQNLNRRCRAIEISPDYCAVTLERMKIAFPDIKIELVKQ